MKRLAFIILIFLILASVVLYCIGRVLSFNQDFASILYDRDGHIINASVSSDEQWRMKCDEAIPDKLEKAILLFEDEYFYYHPGINPISIAKAMHDNHQAGKIVRGGSTLTMQLARISQGNKSRNYKQKIKEILISFSLELAYSKNEIIQLYGQHAPFGGNVVGYCSASWKYFEKSASQLSWAEAAAIAVLPNAPGKIFPGQDQAAFLKKRNFLLNKLHQEGFFDALTLNLALKESLPDKFNLFNQNAPHLHQQLKESASPNTYSAINGELQKEVIQVLDNYGRSYSAKGINNISALVIDNDNGEIISYIGNRDHSKNNSNKDVDIIQAQRSPGSTMKPFLYALSIDKGMITTESLLEDVPLFLNGFSPHNFDRKFSGLVPAKDALSQSLNVPAVNLLQNYGVQLFIDQLRTIGLESTVKDDDHYGLSLILGSSEVKPIELAKGYMNLARTALGKKSVDLLYRLKDEKSSHTNQEYPISQISATQIIEVLTAVKRPRERDGWEYFNSKRKLAWKTGTSYGNRDAWAVGVTPQYTIVVWVGNATGEGKKGLTGLRKGAPVLFSIFDLLPTGDWFCTPIHGHKLVEVCSKSGYRKTSSCNKTKLVPTPHNQPTLEVCTYHQHFTLDINRIYQITNRCYDISEGIDTNLFVLPPKINHYLKLAKGVDYAAPMTHPECKNQQDQLAIIYPPPNSRVLLPREINNEKQALISKATTWNSSDTLYWFLDDTYLQLTTDNHTLLLPELEKGDHSIAVTSINGSSASSVFEVIEE